MLHLFSNTEEDYWFAADTKEHAAELWTTYINDVVGMPEEFEPCPANTWVQIPDEKDIELLIECGPNKETKKASEWAAESIAGYFSGEDIC